MAWDGKKSGLDRERLRAALLDLLRIAERWDSGALARGSKVTRDADELFLHAIVGAIAEHELGEKSVPITRVGKHVVRRLDLFLTKAHDELATALRQRDVEAEDLYQAIRTTGLKSVTRERVERALERLQRDSSDWVRDHGGPEQAAADFLSTVGPRSGRYAFLVRQFLSQKGEGSPMDLAVAARGKDVSPRELVGYMLRLLGYSPRIIRRVFDALYGRGGKVGSRRAQE